MTIVPEPASRVLVVDDDPTVTDVVRRYLERDGYVVRTRVATVGPRWPPRSPHPPALLVLDLMLPTVDGLEVFRQLRAEHPGPDRHAHRPG